MQFIGDIAKDHRFPKTLDMRIVSMIKDIQFFVSCGDLLTYLNFYH